MALRDDAESFAADLNAIADLVNRFGIASRDQKAMDLSRTIRLALRKLARRANGTPAMRRVAAEWCDQIIL